jgi:hypothetical protein
LLPLVLLLKFIGDVLPFAAPAGAKMSTKRLDTVFGVRVKLYDFPLHKRAFAFGNSNIDHIAWGNLTDKYYFTFVVTQAFALSGDSFDF